ncbi:MAG TPA: hypothetical protein VGG74_37080 [Kofleriaceae bacterium]|jgi:hypothetical protein
MLRHVCVALVTSTAPGACSFVGVRGPDTGRPGCTDDYGLVALDSVGAGVSAVLTTVAVADLVSVKPDDPTSRAILTPVSILLGALSLLYIASDTYGIVLVNRCRASRR